MSNETRNVFLGVGGGLMAGGLGVFALTRATCAPAPGALPTETPIPPGANAIAPGAPKPLDVTPSPTHFTLEKATSAELKNYGTVKVSGVPSSVPVSELNMPNNGPDRNGDDHKNPIGAEAFLLADPGTYSWDGRNLTPSIDRDINSGVCTISSAPDVGHNFSTGKTDSAPLVEGTSTLITGARGKFKILARNGNTITLDLKAVPNHMYALVIKALDRDHSTPEDKNTPHGVTVIENSYDRTYLNSTRLGDGQFSSAGYVLDQIRTATTRNSSGADGSRFHTMVLVDANTGAVSVLVQEGADGQWKLEKTNIQAN